MALRLRRGTDAERLTITPLQGELIYTTDTAKIYVGDGATQGGVLIGPYDLENDTTPQLAGDLDLNGNNITGTGNINITGTVTATGDINLGDADADSITVAGLINSNLRPATDQAYDLGSASRYWRNVFAMGATINGALEAESLLVGDILSNDSTVVYDSTTGALNVNSITGDLKGSVVGDDSIPLVDSVSSKIVGPVENSLVKTSNFTVERVEEDLASFKSISDGENVSFVDVLISRGNFSNPTALQAEDPVGGLRFKAHDGTDYRSLSVLFTQLTADADITSDWPKTDVALLTGDGDNLKSTWFRSTGALEVSGPIQPGVYADAAARDAAIPSPTAGMTIFVTDGDGAGNPKFQGNTDGTTGGWVDLN